MPGRVKDDRSTPSRAASRRSGSGDSAAVQRRPRRSSSPAAPDDGVRRLYTAPMMADVLGIPLTAVRHWRRRDLLSPTRRSGSLEWFDFRQLVIGRRLARLLTQGLSLRDIDARLATLSPGGAAEAAQAAGRIVADGSRLSIRRSGRLLGPGGQLQFGFYVDGFADDDDAAIMPLAARAPASAITDSATDVTIPIGAPTTDGCLAELIDLAADLASAGEFAEAAEALRAALQAAPPTASLVFMLAELLYRAGDLTAARERYYAAIELDADHLEARANLGCVLAELGEHDLALAALEGVLRQQPDYADAHWHMAGVLRDVGRRADEERHLRAFLILAPASPWAKLARERLDA